MFIIGLYDFIIFLYSSKNHVGKDSGLFRLLIFYVSRFRDFLFYQPVVLLLNPLILSIDSMFNDYLNNTKENYYLILFKKNSLFLMLYKKIIKGV